MTREGKTIKGIYFSPRETECAALLTRYFSVKKIAEELHISPRTVEFYLLNMRQKIQCNTKTELVEWLLDKQPK